MTNLTALLSTIPSAAFTNRTAALESVIEAASNHTSIDNCSLLIIPLLLVPIVNGAPGFESLVNREQLLTGGSSGGDFWPYLIPLLLLLLGAGAFLRRARCGRRKLADLTPQTPNNMRIRLAQKPPISNGDDPTPVCATTPRMVVKQRTTAPMAPPPVATTEFKSKFRWDVDVGHYLWKGSAGAAGPMNVNWGTKGATSSTPIVVNDVVTVEAGGALSQKAPALPERRVSCRPATPRGPGNQEHQEDDARLPMLPNTQMTSMGASRVDMSANV